MKVVLTTDIVGKQGNPGRSLFSLVPDGAEEKSFCLDFAKRLKARRADIVVTNNKVILISKQQQLSSEDKLVIESERKVDIDYDTALRLRGYISSSVLGAKLHATSGRCEFLVN